MSKKYVISSKNKESLVTLAVTILLSVSSYIDLSAIRHHCRAPPVFPFPFPSSLFSDHIPPFIFTMYDIAGVF